MNAFKKKAAVAKYTPHLEANSEQAVKTMLANEKNEKDEPKFSEDEIAEIIEAAKAALPPDHGKPEEEEESDDDAAQPEQPQPEKPKEFKPIDRSGALQVYTSYKVKPKYEKIRFRGKYEDDLKGYERIGDPIKEHSMEPRHAETMNLQTPNSNVYYFAEGEDAFVPVEKVIPYEE